MKRLFLILTAATFFTGTAAADDFGVTVGAGAGFFGLQNSYSGMRSTFQGGVLSMYQQTFNTFYALAGADLSMDLTKFLNLHGGLWVDVGASQDSGQGLYNYRTAAGPGLILGDFGASLKWPLDVSASLTISPKIGIDEVSYLSGGAGGSDHPTSIEKQSVSPRLITLGTDLDTTIGDGWIIRLPFEIGFSVNGQFADQYAEGGSVPFSTHFRLELLHPL